MAKIPSKQLIRAGELETLKAKLIERELGFCTLDRLLYIKWGDELIPAGDGSIPIPSFTSVFMGNEDGTSGWAAFEKIQAPYDEDTELWVSLDDIKFAAEMAYKDSDGHTIKSSVFQAYSSSGRADPPVYAPVNLEKKMGTGLVTLRMGDGNDLGALVPINPPNADGAFAQGDVLVAKTTANPPFLEWVHPDDVPQGASKNPVTSGAVYNIRYLIDPNLYDPHTGEELILTGSGLDYEKGKYYIIGNTLYICDSASSTEADFSRVSGIVSVLNDIMEFMPNIIIYDYAMDTNECWGKDGTCIKAETVLSDMGEGKIPLMLLRSTRRGTVMGTATVVSGGSTVIFREIPDENGVFREFSNSLYSSTYTWTATEKCVTVFVATYNSTTKDELDAARTAKKLIVMPSVSFGNNLVMDLVLSSYQQFQHAPAVYTFSSGIYADGSYGVATLKSDVWSQEVKFVRSVSRGSVVQIVGNETEYTLLEFIPAFNNGNDFVMKVFTSANASSIRMYSSEARTFRLLGRKHILRADPNNPLEQWSNEDITLAVPSSSGYASFFLDTMQAMTNVYTTITLDAAVIVSDTVIGNLKITNYPSGGSHYMYATYDGK